MSKKVIVIVIAFILSSCIVVVGRHPYSIYAKMIGINEYAKTPKELYRIYLAGESIGFIKSKQELEDYIDSKQEELKKKYNVDKVYAPNDLKIVKEITYDDKILTVDEVYKEIEKIRGTSSFTIDGYKIEIKGIEKAQDEQESIFTDDLVFYVLDKSLFEKSVEKTITAFVDPDRYQAYLNDTQKELGETETGSIITELTITNDIKITKGRIPTGDNIYTTEEDLSKFLLFGTLEEQEKYVVKSGDTIEDIAYNNKLSVNEFLIANTSFKSANDLLYPGQEVNLGLINPQFDLEETEIVKEEKVKNKEIVYKNDDTQYVGYEKVEREGQDGLVLVTTARNIVNGDIHETTKVGEEIVLKPSVDKVVIRGTKRKQVSPSTSIGTNVEVPVGIGGWVWPTNAPYTISSGFQWRGGKHHDGLDITGPGYGSPIKAANNGIVVQSGYTGYNGNFIIIAHSNGYYTYYGHLSARYKQAGDVVMANDVIGAMGNTGYAFGVHLHFGLYNGYPWRGGVAMNPAILYR